MEYNTEILIEGCQKLGLPLSQEQISQFMIYYENLIEKNKVMNLTAITEFEDVMVKHFIDSLAIIKAVDMGKAKRVLDLGTGAGFPGIPLKILYPQTEFVLMDSLNKRVKFLNEVIENCHLENITAVHGRAEEMGRNEEYRESFDLCVSRAVANLSSLSEYCLPFVQKQGWFVSYKAGDIEKELKGAGRAIRLLGGQLQEVVKFELPGSNIERSFVVIKKVEHTAAKYPRKAGTPAKEPL